MKQDTARAEKDAAATRAEFAKSVRHLSEIVTAETGYGVRARLDDALHALTHAEATLRTAREDYARFAALDERDRMEPLTVAEMAAMKDRAGETEAAGGTQCR